MIVYWIHKSHKTYRIRGNPKLTINRGTPILKAFSTLDGQGGYDELVTWGKKIGMYEEDLHAGKSGQLHFDLWGDRLVKGIKELLKESHKGYSWKASREKERENVH